MTMSARDKDAFEQLVARDYHGAYLVSLSLEMAARRLTIDFYGKLGPTNDTFRATAVFFGTNAFTALNPSSTFPDSVEIASFDLWYDDVAEEGTAELRGRKDWTLSWHYEGLSFGAHPAVLSSLTDEA